MNLREIFEEALVRIRASFGIVTSGQLNKLTKKLTGEDLEEYRDQGSELWYGEIRDDLIESGVPEATLRMFDKFTDAPYPWNIVATAGFALLYHSGRFTEMSKLLVAEGMYDIAREMRPTRASPAEAWEMVFSRGLDTDSAKESMRDLGWSEELIDGWEAVAREWTDVGSAMELYRRGELNATGFADRLSRLGFSTEAIADFDKLVERIPGAADLISMAVREAFHPELVSKYHYMDNFPPEFATWLEKQGYSRDWAEKYWVAHWRLPAIGQAFDMLHRRIIDEGEVRDLLRTADIAPIWHQPLIEIAYNPYTRVDARRMHALGVLNDDELVDVMLDMGYDREHAEHMADFYIAYNTRDEREASKSEIISGYREGVLTYEEAIAYLGIIGIAPDLAAYYLAVEDHKRESKLNRAKIDIIEKLYKAGEISREDVYVRFGQLNIPSSQQELLLEEWDIAREPKTTLPTKSELERFYRESVISLDRMKTELDKRGYSAEYIDWYVLDLATRLEAEAREAEIEAREEAQKVEDRIIKTDYDVVRAALDVDIAVQKREIAEDKLLAVQDIPEEIALGLEEDILTRKVRVRELQQQKAEEKLEFRGIGEA